MSEDEPEALPPKASNNIRHQQGLLSLSTPQSTTTSAHAPPSSLHRQRPNSPTFASKHMPVVGNLVGVSGLAPVSDKTTQKQRLPPPKTTPQDGQTAKSAGLKHSTFPPQKSGSERPHTSLHQPHDTKPLQSPPGVTHDGHRPTLNPPPTDDSMEHIEGPRSRFFDTIAASLLAPLFTLSGLDSKSGTEEAVQVVRTAACEGYTQASLDPQQPTTAASTPPVHHEMLEDAKRLAQMLAALQPSYKPSPSVPPQG